MSTHTFTFVLPKAEVLNVNDQSRPGKAHWAVRSKQVNSLRLRGASAWSAALGDGTRSFAKASCTCWVTFRTRSVRRDVANWYPTAKALIDGLVSGHKAIPDMESWVGLLPDDDNDHLIGPDMREFAVDPTLPVGSIRVHLDFKEIQP